MKKVVFLFIISLFIGFFLSWKINDKKVNNELLEYNNNPIIYLENLFRIDSPGTSTNAIEIVNQINDKNKIVNTQAPKYINSITAEAYLAGNLITGEIYVKNNIDKVFPIASLTKLFVAVTASHFFDNNKEILIDQEMLDTLGDAGHLIKNEKFTIKELLYPLLLESSNDAAEAIATSSVYLKFIELMNSLAVEIGMKNTYFKDASGLDFSNVSNSKDLFLLAKYLYEYEKGILEITKQSVINIATSTNHGYHQFISINPFVNYEPFIGGKTGRTNEAKESMISLFNIKTASTTIPIAVIILRSEFGEREMNTERILDMVEKKIRKNI